MQEIYQEINNLIQNRERAVLATIVATEGSVPRKAGTKMLIHEDGTVTGSVGGGNVEYEIKEKAKEILMSGQPELLHLENKESAGGKIDVFLELVLPVDTLYLFGAGRVSQATATIGKVIGFNIIVIDPRPEYNNRKDFPEANSLMVEDYCPYFSKHIMGENDYIIIFTASHAMDEACLHLALGTRAAYVGMIGSKRKVAEIKEHLLEKGVAKEQLEKAHSPIGLDIGAETPEEIALSVMAEVVKVKRSRSG
jgi:xanthine dehydrogenase accessory factor